MIKSKKLSTKLFGLCSNESIISHWMILNRYLLFCVYTYAVKDYKNKGQWKEKTVPGEEFIRRFLMHVPPKHFVRIRHYGLLSCRNKSKKMTNCRNLLGCKKYISSLKNRIAAEMINLLYNIDVCRCSSCGGKMVPHLPDKHTPSVLAHMRC